MPDPNAPPDVLMQNPQGQPVPDVGQSPQQMPQYQPSRGSGVPVPRPILADLFQAFGIGGKSYDTPASGGQMARPTSRLDKFEGFLGNFVQALGAGFANEGRGPGAAMRGAGAAMQAPYQQSLQNYQLQGQAQAQQAETQLKQAQAQPVNVNLGDGTGVQSMPASSAAQVYRGYPSSLVAADAKRDVAAGQNATKMGVEQFKANLQMGKISHIEDYRDPQTGQLGKMGYNMMGQPVGLLPGSLPTSRLLPTTSTSQQWIETSPGKWDKVDKTSTSQKSLPGALPGGRAAPIAPTGPASGFPKKPPSSVTAPSKIPAPPQGTGGSRTLYGGGPIYAFDPKTSETTLTTPQEAQQNGYTNPRKVTAPEIENDRQLNNRLADVATKLTRYEATVQKPLNEKDQGLMASALEDDKLKVALFGAELPVDWMNKLAKSGYMNDMSADGQKRLISYFNARESMQGYQRVLSGGSKSNEKAMQLNLDALPTPLNSPQFANESLKQFKENLTIAGQGLPKMPGITRAKDILGGSSNASNATTRRVIDLTK